MTIKSFEFTKMQADRFSAISSFPKNIRIDHNVNISQIKNISPTEIEVKFTYNIGYSAIGIILFEGALTYSGKADEINKISANKLTPEISTEINNTIINNGSFEAIILSKKIKLPPPIKIEIPVISPKQNKKEPGNSDERIAYS